MIPTIRARMFPMFAVTGPFSAHGNLPANDDDQQIERAVSARVALSSQAGEILFWKRYSKRAIWRTLCSSSVCKQRCLEASLSPTLVFFGNAARQSSKDWAFPVDVRAPGYRGPFVYGKTLKSQIRSATISAARFG